MSSARAVGGSGLAAIPANARKTVQSLKEIVPNSDLVDDEIYAVLKECNMDLDETVQRLLKQDPFHEVKRRRDKKKEWSKDSAEGKLRAATGSAHLRGGRVSGRGPLSRHGSSDFNGVGRGKAVVARENGNVNSSTRVFSTATGSSPSTLSQGPSRSHPLMPSQPVPATTAAISAGLQNGTSAYVRAAPSTHVSWVSSGPGHATMADIVKANGTSLPPSGLSPALVGISLGTPVSTPASHQYLMSGTATIPVTSGVYSSSTDPVLLPSLDTRAAGTQGAIKRDIGTVGNQRSKADWSATSIPIDAMSASPLTSQSLHTTQTSTSSAVANPSLEREIHVTRPSTPPISVTSAGLQDRIASVADVGGQNRHGAGTSSSGAPGSRTAVGGSPFGSRSVYIPQQHPVGTQKGLEWKPKSVVQNSGSLGAVNVASTSEAHRPPSPTASGDSGILSSTTSKLQGVTIQDDQPVIIPNHLQVKDAEQTHLSFGSFGAGFGKSFSSTYAPEESDVQTVSAVESTPVIETPLDPSSASSVSSTPPVAPSQSFVHQSTSAPEDVLTSNEAPAVSLPLVLPSDLPKPDPIAQQGPHFPYLPAIPNYASFNVVQQVPVPQFAYETSDPQPPDVARLPSLVPYTDHTASYYTPIFRPGPDGDVRYPPFVTSNTSTKYNGNIGLVNLTGQNLPSQESATSVLPAVQPAQTSQAGGGGTAVPTMAQQPVPLHAYAGQPGGAPLGHPFANMFGYPYLPSYAYMHTHAPPYQHNYTTNSVYPQAPAGSTYPTATASTYPPGGATAVKYQLSQYKPTNATAIAPHSGAPAGYSGYSSAPSAYAANSSVTVGSTTGYDDVTVQQYKDSIYIPTQQVEGSTVWIQAPLSRDMSVGGMQPSSYYNMPGQAQHGAYAHTQQPAHAHGSHPGAYASVYHPSPSAQTPSTHQLLQQPQSMSAGSSQAGGYQQPQRNQQTWSNY